MSPRNMHTYKPKEFYKKLNELGFYFHHQHASTHRIYANKDGYFVVVPFKGKELNGAMTKLALQRIDRGLCDKLDKDTIKKYADDFYKECGLVI